MDFKNVTISVEVYAMENRISHFSADYRDGRVRLGKKTYHAGIYAVWLLNQFYEKELGARLCVFRQQNWNTAKQLRAGYLDEDAFREAGQEILYILQALPDLQPFCAFDAEKERNEIAEMFSESNASLLQEYFRQRAILADMDDGYIIFGHFPKAYNEAFCKEGEALLREVLSTLDFYDRLGDHARTAFEKLQKFSSRIDEAERLDEEHLLPIALEVFGSEVLPVKTEYVPLRKTSRSQGATVARRMQYDSYYSFIVMDFFEGLHHGHYPRKCGICKKYFLMTSARHQQYCTGMAPFLYRGYKITCRKYAAVIHRKERAKDDPINDVYTKRCSVLRMEKRRGTITPEFAEAAKNLALEHKHRAIQFPEYAMTQYKVDMAREKLYADTAFRMEE